jgi:hypothetical protein
MVKAVKEMKRSPMKRLRSEEQKLILLFQEKVYVLKNEQLQCKIIKLHYDTPVAGHLGQWKTLEMVTHNYWWPGITIHV